MKKMLLISLATLAVTACQNRNNDPFANGNELTKMSDFKGTFSKRNGCINSPLAGGEAVLNKMTGKEEAVDRSHIEKINREAANLTFSIEHYAKANCQGDSLYSVQVYADGDMNKNKNPDLSQDLNLKFTAVKIVPHNQDGAKLLNDKKVCDISDYKVGIPATVNNDCVDASRTVGKEEVVKVRVDQNVLYMGKDASDVNIMSAQQYDK